MKYEISIMSDVDYDKLIAEINLNGKFLALIDQEEGIDKLRIQLSNNLDNIYLDYEEFLDTLRKAKEKLLNDVE